MISFPGLYLSFNINIIAFSFFGIEIYKYAVCIVFGILISCLLCFKSKEKYGIKFQFVLENIIYSSFICLIGARIYYVAFNWQRYKISPIEIINVRDGGLAIYGALIAGMIFVLVRCKIYNIDEKNFFDYISPFLALSQSIGRWGNFFNQEAYGTETTNILRMGLYTNNGYQEVHPTFLYESICTFIIFVILRILQKHRIFKGEIAYFYLFLYSGVRMIIEGVRIDSLMLYNFRISQILSFAIFVVFGILLLKKNIKYISNR